MKEEKDVFASGPIGEQVARVSESGKVNVWERKVEGLEEEVVLVVKNLA